MSAFALKCIAVLTMLIDHVGAAFYAPARDSGIDILNFRAIGRMAFPIFVFFIAEGCRHTRHMRKYACRLGLFALLSQIPFTLLFESAKLYPNRAVVFFDYKTLNIFFTLFLGVCAIACYQAWVEKPRRAPYTIQSAGAIAAVAAFAAMGSMLGTDYGAVGVSFIFICYLAKERATQALALFTMVFILYAGEPPFSYGMRLVLGGGAACAALLLYNGKKGFDSVLIKWLFYVFYPVHLLALFVLYQVLL